GSVILYSNVAGTLSSQPAWEAVRPGDTRAIAAADLNGDGYPELACASSGASVVYGNLNGQLTTLPIWSTPGTSDVYSLAWGDLDRDGDLDLALGQDGDH